MMPKPPRGQLALLPWKCALNPKSVVTCTQQFDGPCQKNGRMPATGQCKLVVAHRRRPFPNPTT